MTSPQSTKTSSEKSYSVYAIFDDKDSSELALERCKQIGFTDSDISVRSPEKEFLKRITKNTKAGSFAATGLIGGLFIGAIAGRSMAMGLMGGIIGALAGFLLGRRIPTNKSPVYEDAVKEGGILMSIRCDDSDAANRANKLLEVAGAHDIVLSPTVHH
ncbi:MAG: hypothetical protein WC635_01710 [Bacteriovorax sp.]|jgi:hypothetical protein